MQITINGEAQTVPGSITVAGLVAHLALDPRKVAVERNRAIVSRSAYENEAVVAGDAIEIVEFIGGG
jgi:thiamine biosynthesis protein ThiS